MIVKVKIFGRYRSCELLKAHRSKRTSQLGFVDVRVLAQDVLAGMPSEWRYVPIELVRKSDHGRIADTLLKGSSDAAK